MERKRLHTPHEREEIREEAETGIVKSAKGIGRLQALKMLDNVISRKRNLDKLYDEFQRDFDNGPLKFFEKWVMPLLPSQAVLKSFGDDLLTQNNFKLTLERLTVEQGSTTQQLDPECEI
jgi:hypothetical protein